jgi:hypothetical protein
MKNVRCEAGRTFRNKTELKRTHQLLFYADYNLLAENKNISKKVAKLPYGGWSRNKHDHVSSPDCVTKSLRTGNYGNRAKLHSRENHEQSKFRECSPQCSSGSSRLLSENGDWNNLYKPTILSIVLYGCETLTHSIREEHRFRVFENTVLKTIFAPKRDEVMGRLAQWRAV